MIATDELQLIAVEPGHARALLRDQAELAGLLGVAVPDHWPCFPQAFSRFANQADAQDAEDTRWRGYFFIDPEAETLIGNGGFKGPPDAVGVIEIGYEIAPAHRNRGFATCAARALLRMAFAHDGVRAVSAHTLPALNASNRVLRKIGMTFVASVDNPDLGEVWRWRITRERYGRE